MNEEANEYEELLTEILKCGYRDLDKLMEIIAMGENWGVLDWNDVEETAKELELKETDFNDLLYIIMTAIFQNLISELDEKDREILNDNFSPYLNYLDSYFNNCLDELDSNSPKEEAIKCLKKEAEELRKKGE